MRGPEQSRLFTRWKNPANGVASYLLTERVAPVQQTFYYTHPSFSADGRYLWFGCGFPPPGGRISQQVLGVADLEREEVRVFHETQFGLSRPVVEPQSGEAYWWSGLELWKRGPGGGDRAVRVNRFPSELASVGALKWIASHPTFSADGRTLSVDAFFQARDGRPICHIGAMPLDGGPFELWQTIEGRYHDHGLFSPTDPDAQLFAFEYWQDHAHEPFDGQRRYHRMWLIRRGEAAQPLLREAVTHSGHEWWGPDGGRVYYLLYGVGVMSVDVKTREERLIWPGILSHAHCDRSERRFVADRMEDPHTPECCVLFRDVDSGKAVEIVNLPPLPADATQCVHLHPHPQFCLDDRYICYTSTALGRVDVALAPVGQFGL